MRHEKLECMDCGGSFYLNEEAARDIIPEGAVKTDAFMAYCPFCGNNHYVTLAGVEIAS